MAKQRHEETQADSSRSALAILIVGVLLVGGLVVWALTRTVDVSSTPPPVDTATVSLDTSTLTATSASNTPPPVTSTTATNATTPPVPLRPPVVEGDKSSVERIAPEDLKAKWDRHEVTVIDVRDEMSYKASHIRGALHMQFAAIEGQIDMIPKGKPIVLYCT